MLRRALLSSALAATATLSACGGAPASDGKLLISDKARNTAPAISQSELASATQSGRSFSVDLYKALAKEKENLFFSPHSIVEALMMTYAGAQGTTATEMREVLHIGMSDDKAHGAMNAIDLALASRGQNQKGVDGQPFRLKVANALWGQDGYAFQSSYLDTIATNYGAGVQLVDFVTDAPGARLAINGWVAQKTEDKIQDLIPEGILSATTRLVLTNAVYFNASWQAPFDPARTDTKPFYTNLELEKSVQAPTMHSVEAATASYQASGVTAVELPYAGRELSMVVIQPDDLASFESALTQTSLDAILAGLSPHLIDLSLPKWKFTDDTSLAAPLKALGMPSAFSASADFSGINGGKDLLIQEVLHKAFVGVDEAGTEAAAATAVIIGVTSIPEYVAVKIDRPFLFLIRDNATGAVVFMGRVVDPTK